MSIDRNELENGSNQDLIQATKDVHGVLYYRINNLQRNLNIANAAVDNLNNKLISMSRHYEESHNCAWKAKYDNLRNNLSVAYEHLLNNKT